MKVELLDLPEVNLSNSAFGRRSMKYKIELATSYDMIFFSLFWLDIGEPPK